MTRVSMARAFRITGGSLTRTAREKTLSDDWMGGVEYLLEGLQGISFHEVTSVLNGQNKLTGDSSVGIDLAPEDPETRDEYLEEFNSVYSGRIKRTWKGGEPMWWSPAAMVISLGERDNLFERGNLIPRCFHYTDGDEHVVGVDTRQIAFEKLWLPKNGFPYGFVFKRCSAPPLWVDKHRNATGAMVAYLTAGGILEHRGHSIRYGEPVKSEVRARPENAPHLLHDEEFKRHCRENPLPPGGPSDLWLATLSGAPEERTGAKSKYREAKEGRRRDREEKLREGENRATLEQIKAAVVQRANEMEDGWLDLEVKPLSDNAISDRDRKDHPDWLTLEPYTIRVARVPFEHWTLRAFPLAAVEGMLSPWEPVSDTGLRLDNDDRHHSDWMLSADAVHNLFGNYGKGFSEPIQTALFDAMNAIQAQYCDTQGVVLSSFGGYKRGRVVHPGPGEAVKRGEIAIIPTASVHYDQALRTAEAVITERGGPLAHVAIVAREVGRTVLQVRGALKRYPVGTRISVDPSRGVVTVLGMEPAALGSWTGDPKRMDDDPHSTGDPQRGQRRHGVRLLGRGFPGWPHGRSSRDQ